MTESYLKEIAVKNGLKAGKKVTIHCSERVQGIQLNKTKTGTVTALYPYHFTVQYKNGVKESYQYYELIHKHKDLVMSIN